MSRERWLDEALEASDRALFTRRARALPTPAVPELGAILAAAARPTRRAAIPARVGVLVALSVASAAAVLGVIAVSALAAHEHAARPVLADDGDASVPLGAAWTWTSCEPAISEPGADEPSAGETCAAVPASLVMASSDGFPRACVEPLQPIGRADDLSLACRREPEMSSP